MPTQIREARLLLAARRPHRAAFSLRRQLPSMRPGPERAIAEWYLDLAESSIADRPRGAIPTRLPPFVTHADDGKYFELLSNRSSGNRASAVPWWLALTAPAALLAAIDAEAESPVAQVAAFVAQARQQRNADLSTEKQIENEIRLTTWSLLFAEMAAETPSLALWSHAVDAFEHGSEGLGRIEAAIDKDPSLEERISAVPALAMRLDAARVRQPEIERRQRLARDQELKRLEQLRRIVRAYRDATHGFALFSAYTAQGNSRAAQTSTVAAMKNLANIGQIVAERNDAHLFDDEPGLDQIAASTARPPVPEPFSADTISLLKSLQSLADYALATLPSGAPDVGLLARAKAWAQSALGEQVEADLPEAPAVPDPSSPLGHWALALAREALGRARLAPAPENAEARKQAADDFEAARGHFARALELLAEKDAENAARADFIEKVKSAKARLDGPDAFLSAADRLTQQGQPRAAWELLREAQQRNGNQAVWLARAEHGRRARIAYAELLNELNQAVQAAIVNGADPHAMLAASKIELDRFWQGLIEPNPAEDDVKTQKAAIAATIKTLRDARAAAGDNADLRAQFDAYLSQALAYESIVANKVDNSTAAEAYRLARDAAAALDALLAKANTPVEQLPLREALVASRLAQGHLSLAILPDYRDEPLLAFSAAFDEAAKIPFAQPAVKALGSPLLAALSRRPGEAGAKLGREERHRREMMTRFVEASFSLRFGAPGAAAEQMAKALEKAQHADSQDTVVPDAARLLAEADGFEAKMALAESMRSFQALASVAAGRADAAVVDLLRALVPGLNVQHINEVDAALVDRAAARAQSPLMSYALALALESTLDTLSPRDTQSVVARSRQAQAAHRQTTELLKSLPLSARYPHLVELNRQMGRRLSEAGDFANRAALLRRRGDLDGAIRELIRGLCRHPASAELWQRYAQARLDRLKREKADANFDDLLAEVDGAAAQGLLADYQRHVIRGAVHEQRDERQYALAAYLRATKAAANSEQRVFAQAKAGAVRARLALAD